MTLQKTATDLKTAGRFGQFGGQYVPETLMAPLTDLELAYQQAMADPDFIKELNFYLRHYANRPSPLYHAQRLTDQLGGAKIYLKREDLNHTGSHKINNAIGQALLAKRMGKTRLIAETGAGQHGVATATVAALFGMSCTVYMGYEDTVKQSLNVFRMQLLGAEVVPVHTGSASLKDATSEALRKWSESIADTYYLVGSVVGPHPYPTLVRDFQTPIGLELIEQSLALEGRLPDCIIACVGGGSNAMGAFHPFAGKHPVKLIGVEAGGRGGVDPDLFQHCASITMGQPGVFHGMKSAFLQDAHGQIQDGYSISSGLDYPGVGPEHAYFGESGLASYVTITDDEAVEAFKHLSKIEGIIPALESAHAVAYAMKLAPTMSKDSLIYVNLSGRGDKDVQMIYQNQLEVL